MVLLLFGVYMVTFDGTQHSTDGLSMLAVAENIVKHGRFDTRQLENWESAKIGLDGAPHTVFPIGPTLFIIPVLTLALLIPKLGLTQTTMILMPLCSAMSAIFLYLSARRLGYSPKVGLTVSLLAGLATMTWLRTRDLVADPLVLFSFAVTFYFAVAYRQERRIGQAALVGLGLGMAVLLKLVNEATAPFFLWYAAAPGDAVFSKKFWRSLKWQPLLAAGLPAAAALVIVFLYNALRFGHPLDSGYRQPYEVIFRTPIWIGFIGYLISPYKSIFLYIPIFILIPFTIKPAWHRHRPELLLIMAVLISYVVVYGAFYDWGGGRSWGPRYLAPLNGLLTLLLLPFVERAWQPGRWLDRTVLVVFSLASLFIQIIGISARDNVFLDAADYWIPPPNFSYWGELRWNEPDQWPIWGHLRLFNLRTLPLIWHWQWAGLDHFDLAALLAALLIVAAGLAGLIAAFRPGQLSKWWPITGWLVALACVAIILVRSYEDPRSIARPGEAAKLWPDYRALVTQLPTLVRPEDAVIFTDRRFEFYLLDLDKSWAQRYVVAKDNQPEILETVPRLLRQAQDGHIWLVTDELNNRLLAYALELWLKERGRITAHHQFGRSVQLTAFSLSPEAQFTAIPPEPQLAVVVDPAEYTFNGIASLLGWDWPELKGGQSPQLRAGQTFRFELYWLYRGKAPEDPFFVRLLDEAGQIAFEAITMPQPGSRLIPGQLQIEVATISLPPDFSPGSHQLQIGFYIPAVDAGELLFPLPSETTELRVTR